MKYCHNEIDYEEQPVTLEITENQIFGSSQAKRIKYPRHINQRVSRNHRNYGAIFNRNFTIPKTCSISNPNSAENTLSILQYQVQDEAAKKTHLENIKLNLERRLQAAKVEGNKDLINLLQKESGELEFS